MKELKANMDSLERKGKRWSEQEDRELLDEVKNGEMIDLISLKHKRTPKAVQSRIYRNIDLLIKGGREEEEVLNEYNIVQKEFDIYRINNFKIEDEEKLVEMLAQDKSYEDISFTLRIPIKIIKKRLLNICKQKYNEGYRIETIEERYKVPRDIILDYIDVNKEEQCAIINNTNEDLDKQCLKENIMNKGQDDSELVKTLNLMIVELHLKVDEMTRRLIRLEERLDKEN